MHQPNTVAKDLDIQLAKTISFFTCACAPAFVLGGRSLGIVLLAGGGGWRDPIPPDPYCFTWGCEHDVVVTDLRNNVCVIKMANLSGRAVGGYLRSNHRGWGGRGETLPRATKMTMSECCTRCGFVRYDGLWMSTGEREEGGKEGGREKGERGRGCGLLLPSGLQLTDFMGWWLA